MNYIFDSHAHYDDHVFDEDREEVLSGLFGNGVARVMNVSARADEIEGVINLAGRYDFMFASAGVHPSEVYGLAEADLKLIENALKNPKVKAVGEIGLDYHYEDTVKPVQKEWFEMQIELAKTYGMPIIVHSREAAADTLDIMKATGARDAGGVIHCFSYEKEMAKLYMDMGFFIGIGGVVTYKNGRKLKEVVEYMPMDRMLLETDCPYLAPVPHRGERNFSGYLNLVVDEISLLKGIDADEIRGITYDNANRMYKI